MHLLASVGVFDLGRKMASVDVFHDDSLAFLALTIYNIL